MRHRSMFVAAALALALASSLPAQEWRGKARIDGQVKNDRGEPVEGCVVKLRWGKSGHGGPDQKTDKNGKWAIFGLAGGPWDVDFEAPGYRAKKIQITLQESNRNDTVEVALEPAPQAAAGTPATQEILVGGQEDLEGDGPGDRGRQRGDDGPELGGGAGELRPGARRASRERGDHRTGRGRVPRRGQQGRGPAIRAPGHREGAGRHASPGRSSPRSRCEKGSAEAGLAALDKVPREKITRPRPCT